jgi:hypothetical protein
LIKSVFGFVFVCSFAVACSSTETREEQAILAALDALRDSSSDDQTKRHQLIDALGKLPATTPLARQARDECADAYRLMAEGKEGTLKIKSELERTGMAPKNALADLEAAEAKLKKSEPAMRACQKASVELTLKRR